MILWKIRNFCMKYFPIIAFLCVLSLTIKKCQRAQSFNNNFEYNNNNSNKKYLKLIYLGDIEKDDGNYKEAERYYEEAKKYDNGAYFHLANLYYNFINQEEGKKKYEIAYNKGIYEAAASLGSISYKNGNFNLAKEWYLKGAENGNKTSIIRLGGLLISENKLNEAKKYLLKIENGNDVKGIYYLMTIYYKENNKDKIRDLKKKIFEKNKMKGIDDEIMLKTNLMLGNEKENKIFELIDEAESLIRINKYDEARGKYEKSLEYGFEGYYFLGNMYKFLNNDVEAMKYYEIAYKKGNMGMAAYKIGNIYEEENNKLEAKKWYQIGINSGNLLSLSSLGLLLKNEGNEKIAKELFLKGANQKNTEAIAGLIGYYQKTGEDKKVKELAKRILEEKGLYYNSSIWIGTADKILLYN